jgi:hypothetical protein
VLRDRPARETAWIFSSASAFAWNAAGWKVVIAFSVAAKSAALSSCSVSKEAMVGSAVPIAYSIDQATSCHLVVFGEQSIDVDPAGCSTAARSLPVTVGEERLEHGANG